MASDDISFKQPQHLRQKLLSMAIEIIFGGILSYMVRNVAKRAVPSSAYGVVISLVYFRKLRGSIVPVPVYTIVLYAYIS